MDSSGASFTRQFRRQRFRLEYPVESPRRDIPPTQLIDENNFAPAYPCDVQGPAPALGVEPFNGGHLSSYSPILRQPITSKKQLGEAWKQLAQEPHLRRNSQNQSTQLHRASQPSQQQQNEPPENRPVPEDDLDAGEVVDDDNVNENTVNRNRRKLRPKVAKDPKVSNKKPPTPKPVPKRKVEPAESNKKRKKFASDGQEEQNPRRHCRPQHQTISEMKQWMTTPHMISLPTDLAALHHPLHLPPLVGFEHTTSPSIYSDSPPLPPGGSSTTSSRRRRSSPGRSPGRRRTAKTLEQQLVQMMHDLQLQDSDRLGIVPYVGSAGQLVTYKPKKPRPKVQLDSESVRVFHLLMTNQEEDAQTTMNWEAERQVYKDKTLDFISRMHLVQGNRRFSRWKGSVVDSIIGTFLTQNVSDHLSSSSFMTLAACFPKKKKDKGYIVEEYEEEVPEVRASKVRRALFADKSADESSSSCMTDLTPDSPPSTQGQLRTEELTAAFSSPSGDNEYMFSNQTQVQDDTAFAYVSSTQDNTAATCICCRQESTNCMVSTQVDNAIGACLCNSQDCISCMLDNQQTVATATYLPSSQDTDCILGSQVDNVSPTDQNKCMKDDQQTVAPKNLKQYARRSRKSRITNIHWKAAGNETASLLESGEESTPPRVVESAGPLKKPGSKKKRNLKLGQTGEFGVDNNDELDSTPVKGGGPERGKLEQKLGSKGKSYHCPQYIRTKVNATKSLSDPPDTVDWDEVRRSDLAELSNIIKSRGMFNILGGRIKAFLNRLHQVHGKIDLEWIRDVSPPLVKEILLSIHGLGIKSVECIRLLTLQQAAFPVDVNVGRILVRLGWVPLQPFPEQVQLHLLDLYPVQESIQQYIWPRLCTLDQQTLYELHYQMITFGKVFCTKKRPNCNACPMQRDCKHFASAYASSRALPAIPGEGKEVPARLPALSQKGKEPAIALLAGENRGGGERNNVELCSISNTITRIRPELAESSTSAFRNIDLNVAPCEPIVEEPEEPILPEPALKVDEASTYTYEYPDMEDSCGSSNGVTLHVNLIPNEEELYVPSTSSGGEVTCREIIQLPLYIPVPKLKNMYRLRTVHHVYELPDNHELLRQLDVRELDDPCYYLLAIWAPGEEGAGVDSNEYVKASLLIPCRTAMRGSFPLNGTYFQVNEVFADHETSIRPLNVDRSLLWNLPRRCVYFGSSVSTIFRNMTTEEIQYCFWRGYVCLRAFDRALRKPQPLATRLHLSASKKGKKRKKRREMEED